MIGMFIAAAVVVIAVTLFLKLLRFALILFIIAVLVIFLLAQSGESVTPSTLPDAPVKAGNI